MRKKWSVTSDYELQSSLKVLSEKTRIPMSKLLDEAIDDLLNKDDYQKYNLTCESEDK